MKKHLRSGNWGVLFLCVWVTAGLVAAARPGALEAEPEPVAATGRVTSIVPPPIEVAEWLRETRQPFPLSQQLKVSPSPVRPRQMQGSVNLLAILVDFSDKQATVTASLTAFDNLLFSPQVVGRGSVRDFFADVSYGHVDVVTVHLPSTTGWRRAPQTYAYYVAGNYGWGAYPNNAGRMVEDLLPLVDPLVDFSHYDNDSDGWVDTLLVIHAGTGAEFSLNANDLWSHASAISLMGGAAQLRDGVYLDSYVTAPEYWDPGVVSSTSTDLTIGVICHEVAHGLWGMPDLYDVDGSSYGIGQWGLMSYGDWNGPAKWDPYLGYSVTDGSSPAIPSAWSRIAMGFDTYYMVLNPLQTCLPAAEIAAGSIARLKSPTLRAQEYFLLENRQQFSGGYDQYLPGSGLLIWHVDEAKWSIYGGPDNNSECRSLPSPHCWGSCTSTHYLVALEQADRSDHLEYLTNRGDGGDPFPGTAGNISWRPYALNPVNPESGSWYDSSCALNSCIDITGINIQSGNACFDVQFTCPVAVAADFGDAPDSQNNHSFPMTAYFGPPPVQAAFPTVYWPAPWPAGPRHHFCKVDSWLGTSVTSELQADLPPDEDPMTNLLPPMDTADLDSTSLGRGFDDGLPLPLPLAHCASTTLPFTVTVVSPVIHSPLPRFVNAWFDWKRDGDWDDVVICPAGGPALEWAVQDMTLSLGPGTYTRISPAFFPFILVAEGQPYETWLRLSIADLPAPSPYDGRGPAVGYDLGETEDYFLTLAPSLSLSTPATQPAPGEQVTYQVQLGGAGNIEAVGVVISDVLPAGVDYVSSNPAGLYDPATRIITWTTNLVPGQVFAADLTVNVTAGFGELVVNTVYLLWGGGIWERDSASFSVGCAPADPQAAFFWSGPTCAGASLLFTNQSTGTAPLSYAWDMDGDGVIDSTALHPTWQYTTPDSYSVTLTVTNMYGCTDSTAAGLSILTHCEQLFIPLILRQ